MILVAISIAYAFCLPKNLFNNPRSTVIESRNGELLGALISQDQQWRFPGMDSIPKKFEICITQFEDEYFFNHFGFNPISIAKALKHNIRQGEIKRGGSTITQQTIRLSRNGKKRTYWEKLKELILATRLELRESKENILNMYASNAPFGGNVVGLDAAAWRYFNRSPHELSWAESATLAVLPNAPSLIFPGKNHELLLKKRNDLLKKLLSKSIIDSLTYSLSMAEELPDKPYSLPQIAPHLLQTIAKNRPGERIQTSIDQRIQTQANIIVANHHKILKQNEIHNIGILILDVKTKQVLAYVGNSPTDKSHQNQVDIINKPRSTGSLLKPFLFSAMLDSGELIPNQLVADIPTQFGSYNPENFNKEYDGAVSASRALSRSLNVPAVRLLNEFGLEKFHDYLKRMSFKDFRKDANHYGLTLILGGAESNLWDLCKNYAGLASTVNHFNDNSSQYYPDEFNDPTLILSEKSNKGKLQFERPVFDAASIYLTLESMKNVNRPEENENWEFFDSSKKIAWKTGTSLGFRDAWAIGTTADYTVGVWVGNADGEGRPGLVGIKTAAPILFDLFDILPKSEWFKIPYDEMSEVKICEESGLRASENCANSKLEFIPIAGLKLNPCQYHSLIHLDETGQYQVNSSCAPLSSISAKPWFTLPPLMAYYYKSKNPFYKPLPPYKENCQEFDDADMQFIYPKSEAAFYLPKDFDETKNSLIAKVAHRQPNIKIYWYLNQDFVGATTGIHEMAFLPSKGEHTLRAIDNNGKEISRKIEILD